MARSPAHCIRQVWSAPHKLDSLWGALQFFRVLQEFFYQHDVDFFLVSMNLITPNND